MTLWQDLVQAEIGLLDVAKEISEEHPEETQALRLVSALVLAEGALACEGIAAHFNCYHTVLASIFNWVTLVRHRPDLVAHVIQELLPQMREAMPGVDWDTLETDLKEVQDA